MEKPDFLAFFYRVFAVPEQRRVLLTQWHARRPKAECARLSDDFYAFLHAILYEPLRFHMHADYFCLFGPTLPIRYAWLKHDADREFLSRLYELRRDHFDVRKEVENNQFDYSGLVKIRDDELIDFTVRNQLARDFVWMCVLPRAGGAGENKLIRLNLIVAVQALLVTPQGKSDVFLAALHQALQGKCDLKEVVCWGNSPLQIHPEQKEK
jgi:hypothetical protein